MGLITQRLRYFIAVFPSFLYTWTHTPTTYVALKFTVQSLVTQLFLYILHLFHRRTRASYVYNECLAWYNVVLTPRIHSSVKFVGLTLATRATVE